MPGHPEVIGTMGQLPDGAVHLIETADDARAFTPRDPDKLAVHHADHALGRRHRRRSWPCCEIASRASSRPRKEDICYATTNRQDAVKRIAPRCDAHDRGRLAQQLQFAATGRGRRAGRLRLRGADRSAPPRSTGTPSAASGGSASPPALRRRRCWSTRSSMPSRRATTATVETVTTAEESIAFKLPRELGEMPAL